MITPRFLWAEIERLASSPSNPETEGQERASTPALSVKSPGSVGRKARRIGVFGPANRKIAKSLIPRPRETEKNTRIIHGLEAIYGIEKTRTVLEQAVAMFHVSNPYVQNEPEVYELFENGILDEALEYFGQSWVIGRPRID